MNENDIFLRKNNSNVGGVVPGKTERMGESQYEIK